MLRTYVKLAILLLLITVNIACRDDGQMGPKTEPTDGCGHGDLTDIPFATTAYEIPNPKGFRPMVVPEDNPQTAEGVQLGRMLFYDPILSIDSTISCASCHDPKLSFSDAEDFAVGVDNRIGDRSSMSLLNVGYHFTGLFWDGRVNTLEEQALHPVENPNEMGDMWANVECKLSRHSDYPKLFREAFGILDKEEITRELAAKALAQFERLIVSSGTSEFDLFIEDFGAGYALSDEATKGFEMYFDVSGKDASCAHCHSGDLLTTSEFLNNGLTPYSNLDDFEDKGLGAITGNRLDNGKFKVPTLRNITLTAPYMHDGRFATLEEVIEHYNSGGHRPIDPTEDNVDNDVVPLNLDFDEKMQLLAFLETFTDTVLVNNPDLSNPFK